jgi:hypothetical protein
MVTIGFILLAIWLVLSGLQSLLEKPMNKATGPVGRVRIGLAIGLMAGCLIALAGCWWGGGGGGYYDGGVWVGGPDVYLFGGGYDHGRDVHNYSRRGAESRGAAHAGGNHGGRR